MSERRLITQQEMADKYHERIPTICYLRVRPADYEISRRGTIKMMYREKDLAKALIQMYMSRRDNYIQKARIWQEKAKEVKRIYEREDDEDRSGSGEAAAGPEHAGAASAAEDPGSLSGSGI